MKKMRLKLGPMECEVLAHIIENYDDRRDIGDFVMLLMYGSLKRLHTKMAQNQTMITMDISDALVLLTVLEHQTDDIRYQLYDIIVKLHQYITNCIAEYPGRKLRIFENQ